VLGTLKNGVGKGVRGMQILCLSRAASSLTAIVCISYEEVTFFKANERRMRLMNSGATAMVQSLLRRRLRNKEWR
jgi:hypothetical protein